MSKRWVRLILGLGAAGAFAWWIAERGGESIRPDAPEISSEPAPPLELDASSLSLPVRIDLATLVAQVEDQVPTTWGDLDTPVSMGQDGGTRVAIELARAPFGATLNGPVAQLSTTIEYRVRGTYDLPLLPDINFACAAGADDEWPRLDVILQAPIALTRDWKLRTRTEVLFLEPSSTDERDRCEVTALGVDITARVVEAAREHLDAHTTTIDSLVAEADLRSSFAAWWAILRDPIELDERVWLDIRPQSIRQGTLTGEGNVVEILAGLEARPRIVVGHRPTPEPIELPPLGSGVPGEGLSVLAQAVGEYDEISRLLTAAVSETRLEVGGRRLILRGARLSGIGGGQVALEVQIDGTVEGRLFFVGTPRYDPDTRLASVPDLAFSVSTSDLLVTGASWVFDTDVESFLRERAVWPVDAAVSWAAEWMERGLNRTLADGVRLEGTVHEVRVVGVRATPEVLIVGAAADADATLVIADVR